MQDYIIKSAKSIMKFMIDFEDEKNKAHKIEVGIDYLNGKVYFDSKFLDIDYDLLEKNIMNSLRPNSPPEPKIPEGIISQMENIKNGKYEVENLANDEQ